MYEDHSWDSLDSSWGQAATRASALSALWSTYVQWRTVETRAIASAQYRWAAAAPSKNNKNNKNNYNSTIVSSVESFLRTCCLRCDLPILGACLYHYWAHHDAMTEKEKAKWAQHVQTLAWQSLAITALHWVLDSFVWDFRGREATQWVLQDQVHPSVFSSKAAVYNDTGEAVQVQGKHMLSLVPTWSRNHNRTTVLPQEVKSVHGGIHSWGLTSGLQVCLAGQDDSCQYVKHGESIKVSTLMRNNNGQNPKKQK
ncbi:hypothetical protein ACA910_021838 [Epithemia clementina (nom. ined.)]